MRFAGAGKGQALVEFALVVPVLLLLTFGVFDLGQMIWQSNTLAFASREGARYAIVHGNGSSDPTGPAPLTDEPIRTAVVRYATGIPDPIVVATWPDGDNQRGSRVLVEVTTRFEPILSSYLMAGALEFTLRGTSQMVIVR